MKLIILAIYGTQGGHILGGTCIRKMGMSNLHVLQPMRKGGVIMQSGRRRKKR